MRILLLLLIFTSLAGCKTTKVFWVKSGIGYEEAVTAEAVCRRDALVRIAESESIETGGFWSPSLGYVQSKFVDACMEAQGFRWGQYDPKY